MQKENIIWIVGSLLISGTLITVAPHNSASNSEISDLQTRLNTITSHTKNEVNSYSTSNAYLKNTTYDKLTIRSKDLMTNLYTWSDGKSYNANKDKIIKDDVSSGGIINSVMPDAKDNSGESQIDALSLTSELKSINVYTSALDSSDATVVAKATASKTSEFSSLANNYIYKIHYDSGSDKIDSVQYVGKESLNTSTGD